MTWNVGNVNDMHYMFYDADTFNGDLSGWDVSQVTTMYGMVSYKIEWNVRRVSESPLT